MRSLFGWVAINVERPDEDDSTLNAFVDIFVRGVSK